MQAKRGVRVGIDVGGTFTDLVAVLPEKIVHHKEPSTPDDPSRAVADGLTAICRNAGLTPSDIDGLAHGTTIGLNAIIARRGARVGMVVTRGLRDILEIGRSRMPSSFDLYAGKEEPLVPRGRIVEIDARLAPDGTPSAVPDPAELDRVAAELAATGSEAAAVVLLNSYADPAFEAALATALAARLPDMPISASAALWPEVREYERALVCVLNAYIQPLMRGYFQRLERRLVELQVTAPLFITASNGGSVSLESAVQRPIETVLSGPASGVTAATRLATAAGARDIVTFDMGGTSSDIAVIGGGVPAFTTHTEAGGLPLIVPAVEVGAIGAGGGSIVSADGAGGVGGASGTDGSGSGTPVVLTVGPRSAGAAPGPVAYGAGGTEPTLTDAYLTAGVLDPDSFLGGRIRLDGPAAAAALGRVGGRLGFDPTTTATGALRVATAGMAVELQKVMARRGLDPREFVLVPYGGAGPTHAAMLAEEVGIGHIIVPPAAATLCALGAAVTDLRRDFARSLRRRLDADGVHRLGEVLADLAGQALGWLKTQRPLDGSDDPTLTVGVDLRYAGQAYELNVDLGDRLDPDIDTLTSAFHTEHERRYGFAEPGSAIELGTARLAISQPRANTPGPVPDRNAATRPAARGALEDSAGTAPSHRKVALPTTGSDGRVMAAVVDRAALGDGDRLAGPVVIEQDDTTVLVPPGWTVLCDPVGNLHLRTDPGSRR